MLVVGTGRSCTVRKVRHPLNDVYADWGPVKNQVDDIEGFLASGSTSLETTIPIAWWVTILIGGMGIVVTAVLAIGFIPQTMRG